MLVSLIMPIRKEEFETGEYYHIYNQSVGKVDIFLDDYDIKRFLQSIKEFNTTLPTGGIYQVSFQQKSENINKLRLPASKLVNVIAYCFNPNHFHFILRQNVDCGISNFMSKLGGYTKFFNNKYERKGTLFQGRFKAKHIDSNDYLLHLSAYINLNDKVHQLRLPASKLVDRSSWNEYIDERVKGICDKDMILHHFKNGNAYKNYAEEALPGIIEGKERLKVLALEDY